MSAADFTFRRPVSEQFLGVRLPLDLPVRSEDRGSSTTGQLSAVPLSAPRILPIPPAVAASRESARDLVARAGQSEFRFELQTSSPRHPDQLGSYIPACMRLRPWVERPIDPSRFRNLRSSTDLMNAVAEGYVPPNSASP